MDPQSERRKEIQEKRRTMAYIKSKNFSRPRSIDFEKPSETLEEMHHILADCGITANSSVSNGTQTLKSNINGTNGIHSNGHHLPSIPLSRPLVVRNPFEMIGTQQVVVPPKNDPAKNHIAYTKETQTEDVCMSLGSKLGSQEFEYDEFYEPDGKIELEFEDSPDHRLAKIRASLGAGDQILQDENLDPRECHIPDLSDDEKRQILQSDEFRSFFNKAGKVVIRELAEINDIVSDYSHNFAVADTEGTGEVLMLNREFLDTNLIDRSISALDYSTFHPELLAAAYNYGTDSSTIHPGIVHVWNSKFKVNFPEYTFTASNPITAFQFSRYHSNIMIGGLFTGQVCVWDNRVNKKTPVQKSPLIVTAHTQPIYCLSTVGNKNAHDLVTISTDGRMCSWALDNLTTPTETVTLNHGIKNLVPVCMNFWKNSGSWFAAGTYDGLLYIGDRHMEGQMKKALNLHNNLISSVDLHKAPGTESDFSNLCLTSSWDWSIKLTELSLQDNNSKSLLNSPMLSFNQHKDLVQDVKWSPVHPAVFASIDSGGKLMVWNLNRDFESPIATLDIGASGQKLLWNINGTQLTVGDKQGRVLLFDVSESISEPKDEEWERMKDVLDEIRDIQVPLDDPVA